MARVQFKLQKKIINIFQNNNNQQSPKELYFNLYEITEEQRQEMSKMAKTLLKRKATKAIQRTRSYLKEIRPDREDWLIWDGGREKYFLDAQTFTKDLMKRNNLPTP